MSKTSDRLKDYQTQMSIYAEQHKLILASDVLDMIEQLQDDLKDDVEKIIAGLKSSNYKKSYISNGENTYKTIKAISKNKAINITKKGGME